ncbi:hypothetical protein BTA51_27210 [Hahella sp. CCB-MM4]|uniref:reverse transcriptase family protein n=1 Tax=Hahella sp. (strain CCB-MM4) TaxID=1926491 RepID=UPI000B9A387E|nr:reverse transcriptase family protein [Hahella sp. CCB-MM4]OZG70167.1 hypothetical protein BTA51_27210 [Hahella sp. CCB-MM4]
MNYKRWVASCLADAFIIGPRDSSAILLRWSKVLGEQPEWLRRLSKEILSPETAHHENLNFSMVLERIQASEDFDEAFSESDQPPRVRYVYLPEAEYSFSAEQHELPKLAGISDVLNWLNLTVNDLEWLCGNYRNAPGASSKLAHYHYRWLEKRRGGSRLLESPKPLLKSIQQKILHDILSAVPQHPAVHGFRAGHSCVSHARQHLEQPLLLKFDLKDFFASIHYPMVFQVYRKLGYPPTVCRILTKLSTNVSPVKILKSRPDTCIDKDDNYFRRPHLPQGAPTSPALSNLAASKLDKRLTGLADTMGFRYSRYADDLVFSGPRLKRGSIDKLQSLVGAIVLEEGFLLNTRKSAVVGQAQRQQVTGIVVNRKANISRQQFDQMKAILHHCIHQGPHHQNRDQVPDFQAHLKGKISYMQSINPQRGNKLMKLFQQIQWQNAD